jgi:branched-chain amino acid transport system ATP-binding protein
VNPVVRAEHLTRAWGTFAAVNDVTFQLDAGARHALIGPNGAGKTTFINLLTGVLEPTRGEVWLEGRRVTTLTQHERVKLGMTRTFQINTLFEGLTVLESVMIAVCERTGGAWNWRVPAARLARERDEAMALLASVGLDAEADVVTKHLPYGKQRLVEIALALATRPKLLLLDEPAAGIPAAGTEEVFAALAALPPEVAILFIEHDMDLVFRFAQRITVLVGGRILMEGSPDEVARDPRVREVYLGEAAHG